MSTPSHNSSSPSSTIWESHSPLFAFSTRRPRTRRKQPNQTYDEAAALLSTVYPTIFSSSSKTITTLLKSPPPPPPHLLLPFQESDFQFNLSIMMKSDHYLLEHDGTEVNLGGENYDSEANGFEEIEQGIDSFMGNIEFGCHHIHSVGPLMEMITNHSSIGLRSALRENDYANCCRFPTVQFEQILPAAESKTSEQFSPLLKLDYDGVLEAWSDKDSPFDLHARLGEIDLFGESGMREASVLRYKEKRRNRLFSNSKKIHIKFANSVPINVPV